MTAETYAPTDSSWDMGPPSAPPDIVKLMVQWFLQNFEDPAHNSRGMRANTSSSGAVHTSRAKSSRMPLALRLHRTP